MLKSLLYLVVIIFFIVLIIILIVVSSQYIKVDIKNPAEDNSLEPEVRDGKVLYYAFLDMSGWSVPEYVIMGV